MENFRININKTLQKISFGAYGLISIIFGAIGDLIAYLMYPGYNPLRRAVSSLCLGPGWLFFQSGTVISGFFALLYLISLEKTFNKEEVNNNVRKYAKISGTISCTTFMTLGVFCGSNLIIAYIHGISALITWISGLLYISFYNFLIINSSNYSKKLGYCGLITTFTLGLMLVFFLLHLFPALRFLMIILPSLEWLNTLSLIVWYLITSIYVIHKKY
ncbi:MAG: DUF998 domain-containing protein [Promethearchaeota archaeon]